MPKIFTLKYIKEQTSLLAKGYECLAEKYVNNTTKYNNKCNKGHIYETCWSYFNSGNRCPKCYGNEKLTTEYIKLKTKKLAEGYECIVEKYINARTKLPFLCNKNHNFMMTWDLFRKGSRCPECWRLGNLKENHPNWKGGKEKAWYNTYSHKINWIEKIRKNPKNKNYLQVKCTNSSCRNWFNPTRAEVESRIAAILNRVKGENRFYCSEKCKQSCSIYHQKLYPKGFINSDSGRDSLIQKEWADMVKERDNYECQRCGRKDLPLIAHHIEGLNVNPVESADIDLGITLCSECDKLAHSEVGCRYVDLRRDNLCLQ